MHTDETHSPQNDPDERSDAKRAASGDEDTGIEIEERLDEALEETFPASDVPSITIDRRKSAGGGCTGEPS